ncbi:RNA methyltransferase [Gammaproteobacteria bacterium]|nr:RNA methyltransferase [bacterium]MDA7851614.1 RNA methyltransferase [Gammaproteobacteria bacterium]MDA8925318.1 RNA methyltransferase [Gammaproteobacteria bacterium]MDA9048646.1 RNA methyltransferase [Gammaproteobacteria bacterium]MDA9154310.1 RNA methyltransferase [Gammaproteobacteria bacterium]
MNPINQFVQIVLVETSHPGNIGSVARAMKNMGLSKLALINPKKFPDPEATALAGNAGNVLDGARVFRTIDEAVKNSKVIFATSARERTIEWPVASAKDAAQEINQLAAEKIEVSILFGREDRGLTNEELQLSNKHLIIPADPEYPVLNIAMSTQVVCYELYQASQSKPIGPWQDFPEYTAEELTHLIEHFNETVFNLKLIDPANPKQILTRMERMFRRLYPDQMEGNFLRGFLKAVNKQIK